MKNSLLRLHKILKLEAENGYNNRAVIGGLERFLVGWEPEAHVDELPAELVTAVVTRLRDYTRMSPTARGEALQGLWRRVQREAEPGLPGLPQPRRTAMPQAAADSLPPGELHERTAQPPTQPARTPIESKPWVEERPTIDVRAIDEQQQEADEVLEPGSIGFSVESALPGIPPKPPADSEPPAALLAPTRVLQGVGAKHAQTLTRLGLYTLRDLLYFFPRRYEDYSKLKPINRLVYGDTTTIIGTVQSVSKRPLRGGNLQMTEALIGDGSGVLRATWFNQPWIARHLRPGEHLALSGKVEQYLGRLVLTNPEVETLEQQQLATNRIVPVYRLTAQLSQRWLRKLVYQVVSYWAPRVRDPYPESLRRAAGLVELPNALLQIHYPDSAESLKAANHRLAFDEIFLMQLGVLRQKRTWKERTGRVFEISDDGLQAQIDRLPYRLTGAQNRAISDIRQDLANGHPMNRLLQGDVGSGKTMIAAVAAVIVTQQSAQAALMAPTSILAEQHYHSLLRLLTENPVPEPPAPAEIPVGDINPDPQEENAAVIEEEQPDGAVENQSEEPVDESTAPVQEEQETAPAETLPPAEPVILAPPPLRPEEIRLMLGATPEAEKRLIREGLADGSIKLVIGTHALIQDDVAFKDLELTIVDEQHRFGVDQRALLRSKGTNPHLLVMTATPIPRSLALTIYGDLDLTVMDELPPGRQPVHTHVLAPRERERGYALIRSQIEQGRQAFIVYPLIDESENSEMKAAVAEHVRLQSEIFPKYRLGLLHGRMSPEDKESIMAAFHAGELNILVSTTVIEVGVDVPNASVMLIEGANRFGLAQLHQLRGRVGRGAESSYCLLVPETPDATENERLQVMAQTNDGFVLAEKDLQQRGPGQFLGTRQAGYSEFQIAGLMDVHLIEKARRHAQALFELDPNLENPAHQAIAELLRIAWGEMKGDIS